MKFSGHDSFICKQLWLKKGFDFVQQGKDFNDPLAVITLGVGKNMVNSINYWLKSFGIIEDKIPTELGRYLLDSETGKDQYLETIGSLWLLHYNLLKTNSASIYNLVFNHFRVNRPMFTKEQLADFIQTTLKSKGLTNTNLNTINADIAVFLRTYLGAKIKTKGSDIEDEFSNLLTDLNLLDTYQSENAIGDMVDWYVIESSTRIDLPWQVVLYAIIDNGSFSKSISFRDLLTSINSPGVLFALNEEGLYDKVEQMVGAYNKQIVYTETAGVRELQFTGKSLKKQDVLDEYFNI